MHSGDHFVLCTTLSEQRQGVQHSLREEHMEYGLIHSTKVLSSNTWKWMSDLCGCISSFGTSLAFRGGPRSFDRPLRATIWAWRCHATSPTWFSGREYPPRKCWGLATESALHEDNLTCSAKLSAVYRHVFFVLKVHVACSTASATTAEQSQVECL